MKAKINNIELEGTPKEIAEIITLIKETKEIKEDIQPVFFREQKKEMNKVCVICNKPLTIKGKYYRKIKKFCSKECRKTFYNHGQFKPNEDGRVIRGRFITSRANSLMKQDIGMSREKAMQIAAWDWNKPHKKTIQKIEIPKDELAYSDFPDLHNLTQMGKMALVGTMFDHAISDGQGSFSNELTIDLELLELAIQGEHDWGLDNIQKFFRSFIKKKRQIEQFMDKGFIDSEGHIKMLISLSLNPIKMSIVFNKKIFQKYKGMGRT